LKKKLAMYTFSLTSLIKEYCSVFKLSETPFSRRAISEILVKRITGRVISMTTPPVCTHSRTRAFQSLSRFASYRHYLNVTDWLYFTYSYRYFLTNIYPYINRIFSAERTKVQCKYNSFYLFVLLQVKKDGVSCNWIHIRSTRIQLRIGSLDSIRSNLNCTRWLAIAYVLL